jgi:hypothetical protein
MFGEGSSRMKTSKRLMVAVASAAASVVLSLSALAQQPPNPPPPNKKPPVQGQPNHPPGPPGPPHPGPGPGPGGPQFHGNAQPGPGAAQFRGAAQPGPGQPGPGRFTHAAGERGYSFRAGGGRRDVGSFNERERAVWFGGRWRHEVHNGRLGYWWEVNGVWYFYDQPFNGPPAYVSELEFLDDPGDDPDGPVLMGQPAPVMVAPPVIYAPRPYAPPPVVCVGPLCIR